MKHKLLLLILVVAAVLRLWGLSSNPPHLSSDEAALGYNAYSILKTGRDEHGEFLPVIFKSFGDWKPGLYVYLDVPFVALFGLNEWSTRLPGALSGIIAVWLVYLLAGEIFKYGEKWRRPTQLFASFFLAISPWHLQFTRGAWEAGISLTLTIAGIYFFFRALRDKERYLISSETNLFIFSALCFALTLWAYQGAKSSTAIILVGLVILFYQGLARLSRGALLKGIVLGLIISLPILISVFDGKTGRIKVFSLLSYKQPDEYVQQILQQDETSKDSWQYLLYHSEPLHFANGVIARWMHHFSGRFLFFEGDWANKKHSVPNNGVLLVLDSLFLISGLVVLVRLFPKTQILFRRKQTCLFLTFWLLSSPLPAALSRDEIHGVRSFNMVVPFVIIMAFGASYLLLWVKESGKIIRAVSFIFVLSYLANFVYYLDGYWVHAPFRNSQAWQYGYKQVVEQVAAVRGQYSEVVVKQDYTQPYIFFLFYGKYDPAKYQKAAKNSYINNIYGDVGFVSGIDNVTFRNINWSGDRLMSGKFFVVDQGVIANETGLREDIKDKSRFNLIEQIRTLDGRIAFILLGVK